MSLLSVFLQKLPILIYRPNIIILFFRDLGERKKKVAAISAVTLEKILLD